MKKEDDELEGKQEEWGKGGEKKRKKTQKTKESGQNLVHSMAIPLHVLHERICKSGLHSGERSNYEIMEGREKKTHNMHVLCGNYVSKKCACACVLVCVSMCACTSSRHRTRGKEGEADAPRKDHPPAATNAQCWTWQWPPPPRKRSPGAR